MLYCRERTIPALLLGKNKGQYGVGVSRDGAQWSIPHFPSSILGVCQSIQRHKDVEQNWLPHATKPCSPTDLKQLFLANMSHEIRTAQLHCGLSGLLKEIHSFSEEGWRSLSIQSTTEPLLSLISDILDMSRMESGAMDFQIGGMQPPLLVDEVLSVTTVQIYHRRCRCLKNVPLHEEKQILADPVAQTNTQ